MRVTDLFLAIPLLVALLIIRQLPAKQAWARTVFGETTSIRLIDHAARRRVLDADRPHRPRSVLSLKEKEFVEAARALGASDWRLISRHLLPNCIGPIIVAVTLTVAAAILTESALSFLGFGVQSATTRRWGNLLAGTKSYVGHGHVVWWFPGLAHRDHGAVRQLPRRRAARRPRPPPASEG